MITGGLGKTMTIENREYEWAVQIDQDHAVNIRYAKYNGAVIDAATAATVTAGIGNSPIYLGLEERYFGPGAILSFDNYRFQVRISGTPYQDGSAWVYECYVADAGSGAYIPGEYLLPGRQVSRIGSAYEEYSDEADILNYEWKKREEYQLLFAKSNRNADGTYSNKGTNGRPKLLKIISLIKWAHKK